MRQIGSYKAALELETSGRTRAVLVSYKFIRVKGIGKFGEVVAGIARI